MEQDQHDQAAGDVSDEGNPGTARSLTGMWGVFYVGARSYIGRAVGTNMERQKAGVRPSRRAVMEAWAVTLQPAFDYFSPLQRIPTQGGQTAIGREPIVIALDFTLDGTPVHIKPDGALFFSEMSEADRSFYEEQIEHVLKANREQRERRAAAQSPIIRPNNNGRTILTPHG